MKSMFEIRSFGERGVPAYAPSSLGMVRLAQAETTATAAPSDTDVSGLTSGIEGLLKQLPADVLGNYNAKYQKCQEQLANGGAVGLAAGAKCLAQLYNELKDFMKNGPPPKPPAPAAGSDLILPVAIGVGGLLVLVWGLSKL